MELIKRIDELITEIKNDTSRSKMVDLGILLIDLSKQYWESKQAYIKAKNEYEREVAMETESFKIYLEDMENRRRLKELEDNPKAKKNKITNVEVTNQVELKLIGLKDKMSESQMIQAYLDPIIKWYYELIQMIKFQDRTTTNDTKFYPQN